MLKKNKFPRSIVIYFWVMVVGVVVLIAIMLPALRSLPPYEERLAEAEQVRQMAVEILESHDIAVGDLKIASFESTSDGEEEIAGKVRLRRTLDEEAGYITVEWKYERGELAVQWVRFGRNGRVLYP